MRVRKKMDGQKQKTNFNDSLTIEGVSHHVIVGDDVLGFVETSDNYGSNRSYARLT
jgi:hypothetical protein